MGRNGKEIFSKPDQSGRLFAQIVSATVLLIVLSGCQTQRNQTEPFTTGSLGNHRLINAADLTDEGALAAVQTWSTAYAADERDKLAALNYASALRAAGETDQAVSVMRKATIYHPEDQSVLAEYGKALADDAQFSEALKAVQRAQRRDNPDWRLLATEGGILDSLGDHEAARSAYRQALVLAPDEPQILNNLGLSHVLTGELAKAETYLHQAASQERASIKVRQNLAMVLALQGRLDEARDLATRDLPKEQADANMAYLSSLLQQQDNWADLKDNG